MDSSTQNHLKAMRQKEPLATFAKIWQMLERQHSHDQVGARRREWERVSLKSGEVTLQNWRNYTSSFEVALARAEGISEREAEEKILRDLPFQWRERLTKECVREGRGSHWVRAAKPVPFRKDELLDMFMGASGETGFRAEDRQLELMIKCPSEEAQDKVLELNGWECDEGILKLQWATRRLTAVEMCKWVEHELRVEAELQPLNPRPRRVSLVSDGSDGERSPRTQGGEALDRPQSEGGDRQPRSEQRTRTGDQPSQTKGQPQEGSKGKGGDRGKSRSPPPPPKGAGRSPSPTKGKGAPQSKGNAKDYSMDCFPCWREGRPYKHNYWECEHWKKIEVLRGKGGAKRGQTQGQADGKDQPHGGNTPPAQPNQA